MSDTDREGGRESSEISLYHTDLGGTNPPENIDRKERNLALRGSSIALRDSGLSIRAIAQRLGLAPRTVAKWITRWNTSGNLNDLRKFKLCAYLDLL